MESSNTIDPHEVYESSSDEEEFSKVNNKQTLSQLNINEEKFSQQNVSIVCYYPDKNILKAIANKQLKKFEDLGEAFEKAKESEIESHQGFLGLKQDLLDSQIQSRSSKNELKFRIWIDTEKALSSTLVLNYEIKKSNIKKIKLKSYIDDIKIIGSQDYPNKLIINLKIHNDMMNNFNKKMINFNENMNEYEEKMEDDSKMQSKIFKQLVRYTANEGTLHPTTFENISWMIGLLNPENCPRTFMNKDLQQYFLKTLKDILQQKDFYKMSKKEKKNYVNFFSVLILLLEDVELKDLFFIFNSIFQVTYKKEMKKDFKKRVKELKIQIKKTDNNKIHEIILAMFEYKQTEENIELLKIFVKWAVRNFYTKSKIPKDAYNLIKKFVSFFNNNEEVDPFNKVQRDELKKIIDTLILFEINQIVFSIMEKIRENKSNCKFIKPFLYLIIFKYKQKRDQGNILSKLLSEIIKEYSIEIIKIFNNIDALSREKEDKSLQDAMERWPVIEQSLNMLVTNIYNSEDQFWECFNKLWNLNNFDKFVNKRSNKQSYNSITAGLQMNMKKDLQNNNYENLNKFFDNEANFYVDYLNFFFQIMKDSLLSFSQDLKHYTYFFEKISKYHEYLQKNSKVKQTKELKNIVNTTLRNICSNSKIYLALQCLEFIHIKLKGNILKEDFKIFENDYNNQMFSKSFWNKVLAFKKNFPQLNEIIYTGLNNLTNDFTRPKQLESKVDNTFFLKFENSHLVILHHYFVKVKKLYSKYLKMDEDEINELDFDDEMDEDDSEKPKFEKEYIIKERDLNFFKMIDLLHCSELFELLKKIFLIANTNKLRNLLIENRTTKLIFDLLQINRDSKDISFKFEELVFIQVFQLDVLYENADLFINPKFQKDCFEMFSKQRRSYLGVIGKVEFNISISNMEFFIKICKPKHLEQERNRIIEHLRTQTVKKININNSKTNGLELEELSKWSESKIFIRFLTFDLLLNGYYKALEEDLNPEFESDVCGLMKEFGVPKEQIEKEKG